MGASASSSAFPVNIQSWFPLGLTGWISLHSKGLSRVLYDTTVWKHQFFSAQPFFLLSNCDIDQEIGLAFWVLVVKFDNNPLK